MDLMEFLEKSQKFEEIGTAFKKVLKLRVAE